MWWHTCKGCVAGLRRWLGQEREGVDVLGAHGGDVPVVEGGDLGEAESLGEGDHGGVGGAEREVSIGLDEFGHAGEI